MVAKATEMRPKSEQTKKGRREGNEDGGATRRTAEGAEAAGNQAGWHTAHGGPSRTISHPGLSC